MVNTLVDKSYLELFEEISFKEDDNKESKEQEETEEKDNTKEEDDRDLISSIDMKVALVNFLKHKEGYKEKLGALEEFLSELLVQVVTKNKLLDKNPEEVEEYEEKGSADFFEMLYDILFESLSNEKTAFLRTYLEAASFNEDNILFESSDDELTESTKEILREILGEGSDVAIIKKLLDMDSSERKKYYKKSLWQATKDLLEEQDDKKAKKLFDDLSESEKEVLNQKAKERVSEKFFDKSVLEKALKNLNGDEDKKNKIAEMIKKLSDKEKKALASTLGKLWKGAGNIFKGLLKGAVKVAKGAAKDVAKVATSDVGRTAIVQGAASINPAVGFAAHVLTGGLKKSLRKW